MQGFAIVNNFRCPSARRFACLINNVRSVPASSIYLIGRYLCEGLVDMSLWPVRVRKSKQGVLNPTCAYATAEKIIDIAGKSVQIEMYPGP